MKACRGFVLVGAFLALSGCTIAKISGAGSRPIVLNNLPGEYEVLRSFEIDELVVFDYTNTYELDRFVSKVLASHPDADAAVNVKMDLRSSPGSFFINLFTLGLASAKQVVVRGDVIRFRK